MKKFIKGMLIAAGCFFAAGVILGIIGIAGVNYMDKKYGNTENHSLVRDAWDSVRKWDFRWLRGDGSGLALVYDGIEFDEAHGLTYGSFTDDSLREEDIYRLDLEIGGGSLTICQGDGLILKKDGGPECQYYIEGDTFYLKQRCPVGGGETDLTLTLPEGVMLDEADIMMGAGEIVTKGLFEARKIEIELDAGELNMEEVKADTFSAEVAMGSVEVGKLDTIECDTSVDMGNISLRESLITGNLDAEVNMGEISIFLRDSYEDHDYEIDCNMGDITVAAENGEAREYSGLSSSVELYGRNGNGISLYDLDCDMGSILVKFSGTEGKDSTAKPSDGAKGKTGAPGEETPGTGSGDDTGNGFSGLPEVPEIEDIYGVEDNWPESIGRENTDTTAEDFSFDIWIPEPMTLEITCVTNSGELDLEIESGNGKDIFEKDDIRTGTFEVKADSVGMYKVHFECDDHTGSFWIRPKE